HIRGLVVAQDTAGSADSVLLERFLTGRDEAAFEALVRRHGPMVLGVCRRILPNPHDAEDAFQATFLVLVRKAASIAKRELLGNSGCPRERCRAGWPGQRPSWPNGSRAAGSRSAAQL